MRGTFLAAVIGATIALGSAAHASTYDFDFFGPSVSGTVELTYGTATDASYSNAFVVTGISGSFTDTNIGIVDTPIGMLEPRNFATPSGDNHLAPNSFSRFDVATGLPPDANNVLTYDNLFWPGGSSPTATDYPFGGGLLDIYGLMFDIGDGRVVNLWSNGDTGSGVDYGVAVATSTTALDYVTDGVAVPEPATLTLLGTGIVLLRMIRRRSLAST